MAEGGLLSLEGPEGHVQWNHLPQDWSDVSSLSNTLKTCRGGIHRFFASKAGTLQSVDIIGQGNCEEPDLSGSRGVTDTVCTAEWVVDPLEVTSFAFPLLHHWDKGRVRVWSQTQGFQAKPLAVGQQTGKSLIKSLRGYSGWVSLGAKVGSVWSWASYWGFWNLSFLTCKMGISSLPTL